MRLLRLVALTALFAMTTTEETHAWGQDGHRVTAEIAQRNLTPAATKAISELVGEESLAELSTWPDEMRSDSSWDIALPWHYISIDDDETWEEFERSPEGDVLSILEKLETFLREPNSETLVLKRVMNSKGLQLKTSLTKEIGKRDALAFYIHFLGDLHQPLHVGRREDQGGNRIQVEWFDEELSLHKVWDESLIESLNLSYTEFATFLNRATAGEQEQWNAGSYLDWAKESREVREAVYDFGAQRKSYFLNVVEPPSLGYSYRFKALPIVRMRLKQAGFRIAGRLNDIFGE